MELLLNANNSSWLSQSLSDGGLFWLIQLLAGGG
jgi:hypothetical protein